jgi:hypothetical protein
VLVLLARDDEDTLHGMRLLAESEEDDLGACESERCFQVLYEVESNPPCGLMLCNRARKMTG